MVGKSPAPVNDDLLVCAQQRARTVEQDWEEGWESREGQ